VHNFCERVFVKGVKRLPPATAHGNVFDASILRRDNRHADGSVHGAFERDLRRESSTQSAVLRKGKVRQTFEDRRLPARLVAHDHDLRKRDVMTNIALEETINLLEHAGVGEAELLLLAVVFLPFVSHVGTVDLVDL
jgi:hypothetical protein